MCHPRYRRVWGGLLLVGILGSLLLSARPVQACSCAQPLLPHAAYERATSVFAGTVVAVEPRHDPVRHHVTLTASAPFVRVVAFPGNSGEIVTLRVAEVWKGPVRPTLHVRTSTSHGDCGYRFEAGETYLVYTYGSVERGWTSQCHATARLVDAAPHLHRLGAGTVPPAPNARTSAFPMLYLVVLLVILALCSFGGWHYMRKWLGRT